MTTHLYCIVPDDASGEPPVGLSGVSGAHVRALVVDRMVAWVSDSDRAARPSLDGVKAHDAVVEAALETGVTPVPVRFGQRFADDAACRAALESRAESVESLVAAMRGAVEMTLLVTPSARRMLRELEPVLPDMFDAREPGAGRRYLDALRGREVATRAVQSVTDELAGRIEAAVAKLVRRSAAHEFARPPGAHPGAAPVPLRTISHLINRADVDAYRAAVRGVQAAADLRVLMVGPRAPYSFCALKGDAGAHGMNLAD
jgi:hypothetical protein